MAYDLIGNSSCFFPSFLSFVSPANSAPRASSPSGENQEATRKLGTISSSFPPKELKEEVFGRKDVKADKNLRRSWKYSGEHGGGRRAGPRQVSLRLSTALHSNPGKGHREGPQCRPDVGSTHPRKSLLLCESKI